MPKHYTCLRAGHPLSNRLDGRLDKPAWRAAPWSDSFVDILGGSAATPALRTRVKMLWDDKYLYIGAELEEPHVWATITQRDAVIFQDNDFEVFIDPDGDNHQYYEIEINALNTVWDLLLIKPYRDGGPAVNGWDIAGIKTAVHVDGTLNDPSDRDNGWSVEMALPWNALKECAHRTCPPVHGDSWRINFSRVQWETSVVDGKYLKAPGRAEDNWVWSPQGVVDMHRPETWGYVTFSKESEFRDGVAPSFSDPAEPVKNLLMQIYYAQRDYFKTNGKYAAEMGELRIQWPTAFSARGALKLECMAHAFQASVEAQLNGKRTTWHIREDSRLWSTE